MSENAEKEKTIFKIVYFVTYELRMLSLSSTYVGFFEVCIFAK